MKIRVWVKIPGVGEKERMIEIEDSDIRIEWGPHEIAQEHVGQMFEWGWEEVEDNG